MSDCIFCRIARHEIPATVVHEDPECIAFRDLQPRSPVHVLIIPKRHIASVNELAAGDEALAGHLLPPRATLPVRKVWTKAATGWCSCRTGRRPERGPPARAPAGRPGVALAARVIGRGCWFRGGKGIQPTEAGVSELRDRLREDMNNARRAHDKLRTLVLGTTLAELKNREIELGREAADSDVIEVVNRAVKQRREAAEQIRAAAARSWRPGRSRRAEMLGHYLPQPLTEAEVREVVRAAIGAGARTVGEVMPRIMPLLKGRFDGREANRIVREELATP